MSFFYQICLIELILNPSNSNQMYTKYLIYKIFHNLRNYSNIIIFYGQKQFSINTTDYNFSSKNIYTMLTFSKVHVRYLFKLLKEAIRNSYHYNVSPLTA